MSNIYLGKGMSALADSILCGCLFPPFERDDAVPFVVGMTSEHRRRLARAYAVCHPRFIQRFNYWQAIRLPVEHMSYKWVDEIVVTLNRANTTPR